MSKTVGFSSSPQLGGLSWSYYKIVDVISSLIRSFPVYAVDGPRVPGPGRLYSYTNVKYYSSLEFFA
jgi:hypothetical protein